MPERWKDKGALLQNLIDAGCDSDTVVHFFEIGRNENMSEQIALLAIHRKNLLQKIHQEQKCLDCLDFLIYKLKEKTIDI